MAITWESVCRVPRGMVDLRGTLDPPKSYFSGIVMYVIILSAVNSVGPFQFAKLLGVELCSTFLQGTVEQNPSKHSVS